MRDNSSVRYEKAKEKNGGGVTGTVNRYISRAGIPNNIPVWTNRLLKTWTFFEQNCAGPNSKEAQSLNVYRGSIKTDKRIPLLSARVRSRQYRRRPGTRQMRETEKTPKSATEWISAPKPYWKSRLLCRQSGSTKH